MPAHEDELLAFLSPGYLGLFQAAVHTGWLDYAATVSIVFIPLTEVSGKNKKSVIPSSSPQNMAQVNFDAFPKFLLKF